MNIYVFFTCGDPYEKCSDVKEFPDILKAEEWINSEIASHSPGWIGVDKVIQGFELKTSVARYIDRMEISR